MPERFGRGFPRTLAAFAAVAAAGCSAASTSAPAPSPAKPGTGTPAGFSQPPTRCHARGTGLFALPDPRCTPGALNPDVTPGNKGNTICRSGWTKTVRPPESVTEPEKLASMKRYGVGPPSAYEYDHLVPLELGGAPNSPLNLWPERNFPNAGPHTFDHNPKDKLEFKLRGLVCRGRLSLADAQRMIATDWASAYGRYEGSR